MFGLEVFVGIFIGILAVFTLGVNIYRIHNDYYRDTSNETTDDRVVRYFKRGASSFIAIIALLLLPVIARTVVGIGTALIQGTLSLGEPLTSQFHATQTQWDISLGFGSYPIASIFGFIIGLITIILTLFIARSRNLALRDYLIQKREEADKETNNIKITELKDVLRKPANDQEER